jgi:hypothetical protein
MFLLLPVPANALLANAGLASAAPGKNRYPRSARHTAASSGAVVQLVPVPATWPHPANVIEVLLNVTACPSAVALNRLESSC